jgi:hypothetical protein
VITKADKQIRTTKKTTGFPDARGLLLLVSDGNYFLRPEQVLGLAGRILGRRFSNINSVVYFTVNSAVDMPNLNRDGLLWVQGFREGIDPVSQEFLSKLKTGWFQNLAIRLGVDIPEYNIEGDALIEKMRFIREVEISSISGVGCARCSAKHEFGDVYRLIGPIPPAAESEGRFSVEDLVRCREKKSADGSLVLEAFERISIGTPLRFRA